VDEAEAQDHPKGYTVCAEPGCPELVPDTGPKITAESYCDAHRVLYELDEIEGSTDDSGLRPRMSSRASVKDVPVERVTPPSWP
jgi:hypothetical protein